MSASGVRFRVPHPRRALVERARLVRLLPGSADGMPRLLLLAAPAGFGKTTLLMQWLVSLEESPNPPALAWLSVDAADRDVRHFITNLLTAVEGATDGVGGKARALLQRARPPHTEAVLTQLIADLYDLATPLVIALDDFHAADSPETQSAVGFLLQHLPTRTTVAMTTRADPALALSRMRARGELLEIRAADLRFTTTEAGEFLTDVMDLPLTDAQVSALEDRTEGWPAGLQLAALSARTRRDDVARFVRDFTGSHRFVLDYLLEDVLAAEDESTRTFLLRTSILEHLSGELCDAVAGDQNGQKGQRHLERLEQRNLFVIPLDDTRHWFRYHHLFADALRARLLAESPDVVQDLHRSASTWQARHGLLLDAVRHAREAHDDELTAYLVEAAIPQLRRQRLDQTLIDLVAPLSESVVRSLPTLATTRAWAHLAHGELDLVDTWLTAADEADGPGDPGPPSISLPPEIERQRRDERRLVPGTVAIYRASLGQAAGDVDAIVEHATRARDLARPDDHLLRASAAGFLGLADWIEGDLDQARARFAETRHHLDAAGNTADALATSVPVAAMTLGLGRPDLARRLLEQALASAAALDGPALSSHADLHVALADVLREHGDLGAAQEHLAAARDLGDGASLPENRFRWYAVSADLLSSTGDHVGALDRLERAEELYLPGFFPDIQPLAARRARILLRQNRIDEARAWADERGLPSGDPLTYRNEYAHLTLARLLIAEADPRAARDLLDRLLLDAESAGRVGGVIDALVVRALAHRAVGDSHAAAQDLSRALTLGVPAGHRRVFLDEGPAVAAVLHTLADATDAPDGTEARAIARELLATGPSPAAAPPNPHALTDRELDVLRLLAGDLTGPQLAAHLFVSINTLRTHTRRIFTKLDVTTRRAAVTRARELGLL